MKSKRATSSFVSVGIRNCRQMIVTTIGMSFFGSLFALLLLVMLDGCLPPQDTDKGFTSQLADLQQDPFNTARLNCFLNLKDEQGSAIRLEVSSIEVFNEAKGLPLTRGPMIIDSAAIGTGQFFLGSIALPPGRYNHLRIMVTKGEVQQADGNYAVIASEPFSVEVNLSPGMNLESEDSSSLLVTWDVQNSLLAGNNLAPDLTAIPSLRQMLLNLVFVSCPDIDTVFVLRTDKNWVVDSFGLKGGPTYLAIDPDGRDLLYVLASRDRMVRVVELSTFRVINFFAVPLNDKPTFMTMSPDGRDAFLLDENNGYLSRVNLTTGGIVSRVLLGDRPIYAAYLQEQNQLAVSLSLNQKVLLLDPHSLRVMRSFSTGNTPQGLIVLDNQLILAEYGDNTVSITDLSSRGRQNRLSVGFGPRRLLETDNQIYVSNYQDGSLSVLVPGQFGVIQEIHGLGRPCEMVFDKSYSRVYVADEKRAALAVIDTNSNKLTKYIALGARPFDLECDSVGELKKCE